MKYFKHFLAVALTVLVALAVATPALAVDITVTRDDTYNGENDTAAGGRSYSYKQIFRATLSGTNNSTGGGYDEDTGNPGDITASLQKGYSYYLKATDDAAAIAALGTWNSTTKTWTKAQGNLWFKLTPSADGTQYIVEWDNAATTSAEAQNAARWLDANAVAITSGSLTFDAASESWKATGLDAGYYLIKGGTGANSVANLVAATTNINIAEKNDYPPVDKTQADEDNATQTDDDKNVAVGDVLTYQVKVTIPATAAVGNTILVYDTPSIGLDYNDDVTVVSNPGSATVAAASSSEEVAGAAWTQKITVTDGSQGKDVVFEFTMTVTEDALVDTGKINDSALIYNNEYDSKPDSVKYKTYYTGIIKIDGDTEEPLAGIEFMLKENGTEFKVTKKGEYYVYDANGSSTVVTDANGKIIIRGLDNDKTYTLTETKTKDGYNLLVGDKTLTLIEDTFTITEGDDGEQTATPTYDPNTTFDQVINKKGTVLPSTGGIGTTIFYIVGGAMIITAGVLLVTKRRLAKLED